MGVMGVALATVTCQGISAAMVTWILMKGNDLFQLRFREIRFYRVSLRAVLRIGIPAALEATMYTIANLIIQVFVNELGTDTVAAGNLCKDRCSLLDGCQCLWNLDHNLCRSEFWCRESAQDAKERGCMHGDGICRSVSGKRCPVCTGRSSLPSVYDGRGSCSDWRGYDAFSCFRHILCML